jgi:hypothetical protein
VRRILSAATCALFLVLVASSTVRADAKSDCRIEYDKSDGSTQLAYVKNTNGSKKVAVTVSVTQTTNGSSRKLPDQVHHLAAGQRAFCGGTVSLGSTYTYTVVGASYE